MRRIRVCQLITTLGVGGAERGLLELCRRLDRGRFDVRVVALRGGPVAARLARAGIEVHVLGLRGKWDAPRLARLPRLLVRLGPDVLHTHLFHADLAGRAAAAVAGVPRLVHTVWTAEGRWRPWQFAFARLARPWCARIVCVSPGVREHHARRSGLPSGDYETICWGVDCEAFARDEDARRRLREQWGVPAGRPVVAFVGRLEFYKGVRPLLAAMDRLAAGGDPGFDLVLAGDGPLRGAVEQFLARRLGGRHARWLGQVEDVPAVLSAADAFVMPSLWEGWPLALGEAMAAGLPAVGTNVPGVRDLLVPGRTGLLVPPSDPAALGDALAGLTADVDARDRMAAAARRRVVEQFSLEATVAAHERLYEVLARRSP